MATRTLIAGRQHAGRSVSEVLWEEFRLARPQVLDCVRRRQVRVDGRICTQPRRQVRVGQRVEVHLPDRASPKPATPAAARKKPAAPPAPKPSPLARTIAIRHSDADIIVVDKPAGLTSVRHADETAAKGTRARRYLPATLVDLLPGVLAANGVKGSGRVRAVHRLDKETSGLLVLARTPAAEGHLGRQFRDHSVGRLYLALVRGKAVEGRIESSLVHDRGDGRRGSGMGGQRAVTHVRVVETLGEFTLVECRLETGRTHQVRIHLGEAGTPLCGERIYDRPLKGLPLADTSGAERPMLHAATLELDHPTSGERLPFTAAMPGDMAALVERLRKHP